LQRRATVIGRLAQTQQVSVAAADAAAVELGIYRRLVYVPVRRWREGSVAVILM
jgi:putative transposase